MSASNFCTMENFPLIVRDFYNTFKRCSVCGTLQDTENETCDICGTDDMEEVSLFDEYECYDTCRSIQSILDDLNRDLLFYKVELRDGYYTGVQFYVETVHDVEHDYYTNEDCHDYFDCCRSVARRKYAAEQNRITRKLRQLADEFGFEEIVCTAVFSNGEAMYGRVKNPRAKLKAAVSGINQYVKAG